MKEKSCVDLLRACAQKKDLCTGRRIHAHLGLLRKSSSVLKALVKMYAKCGVVADAQALLDELSVRDAFSWNALIVAYSHDGQAENALRCFEQMQQEGFSAKEVTFFCILKVCGSIRAAHKGEQIYVKLLMQGVQGDDSVLGTALLNMYTKCGALEKARQVLRKLPRRDTVSWNTLIAGYAQQGQGQEALNYFEQMQQEGLSPSPVTYTCILKSCGCIGAVEKGSEIHDLIVKQGLLTNDVAIGSALVDMYIKCGALAKAKEVLVGIRILNIVLWNALITRYIEQGQEEDALKCFKEMQQRGTFPDAVTFICILKACGNLKLALTGKEIHDEISKQGLLSCNINLGNALVDMYAKCGALDKAQQVLEELPVRDVITWSTLIAGYAQQGQGQKAFNCFAHMQNDGLSPNAVTFISLLKACGNMRDADMGEQIHDEVLRQGFLKDSSALGNALVDMYSKCGAFSKAEEVLEELPKKDVITWNALIARLVQQGEGENALDCYQRMQSKAITPDEITCTCILKACGSLGFLEKGMQIHEEITRNGLLRDNLVLGNALIDMYVKCGALVRAQHVLEGLDVRNIVTWSTLIAGHAQQGQGQDAFHCLIRMQNEGLSPNPFTFSSVLSACSHSGMVDEGQMCFLDMQANYGITPVLEHHICMVDLLGRAGHFTKAMALIEIMPLLDHSLVWSALLSACKIRGNVDLGIWAFQHTVQIIGGDAMPYLCMSGLCSAAGLQEDAEQIGTLRLRTTAWNSSGCRWSMDVNESEYSYMMQEKAYEHSEYIYAC